MEVESHTVPSVSDAALAHAVVNSVVKRHGILLERTLANGLVASGRFDVLVDVAIPVTDAAHELLLARNI